MKRMDRRERLVAMLLAVLLLTLVTSALFIACQGGHECAGEGCPVCFQIGALRELLSKLCAAGCALAAPLALASALAARSCRFAASRGAATLVALNVKLSD